MPDAEVGRLLLTRFILVHADDMAAKFECLLHMMRKLYCFAQHGCCDDNADALSNQELLLPGHLLCAFLKEKLDEVRQLPLLLVTRKMMIMMHINPVTHQTDITNCKSADCAAHSHSRPSSPRQRVMREWSPTDYGATSPVIVQPHI